MSDLSSGQWINRIIHDDCINVMQKMPENSVHLTVTSPPYGTMRQYGGHQFDAEWTIELIERVMMPGGIVVWIEQDQVKDGVCSGSVFEAWDFFRMSGFKLIAPLVIEKSGMRTHMAKHYGAPEFALVFAKGKPRYMRTICDRPNTTAGMPIRHNMRKRDGSLLCEPTKRIVKPFGRRSSIWRYITGFNNSAKDKIAYEHPAIMPEGLAEDLIVSFSRPGDLVFDPMCGSGTTAKMALLNYRKFLGVEVHMPYVDVARKRVQMAFAEQQRRLDEDWTHLRTEDIDYETV